MEHTWKVVAVAAGGRGTVTEFVKSNYCEVQGGALVFKRYAHDLAPAYLAFGPGYWVSVELLPEPEPEEDAQDAVQKAS